MGSYLETVAEVYADAARNPDPGLCCTNAPAWRLPDLRIPEAMQRLNYGCGSVVDPRDLRPDDTVLYVGVGGGLEALQFAYWTRRPGGVLAIDPVADMRAQAARNLEEAARLNPWFRPEFVTLLDGSALALPVPTKSVSVAAQNCLFNIFTPDDLRQALDEIVRVLKPGGFFATSDPITPVPLPEAFRADEIARARCLSGCQTLEDYLAVFADAGFGRIEVRAKFPYRYLTPAEYPALERDILLESVEVVAFKVPPAEEGAAIFTGRTATYTGPDEAFEDASGNRLPCGMPVAVSDAAAARLARVPAVYLTPATFHHRGGGCC